MSTPIVESTKTIEPIAGHPVEMQRLRCGEGRCRWNQYGEQAEVHRAYDLHHASSHRQLNVGDGVTMVLPQDRYPYVVVDTPREGVAVVVRLRDVGANTGHSPDHFNGPFPVWSHRYTDAERATMRTGARTTIRRSVVDHRWYEGGLAGTPFAVDGARYHRDHSL